MNQWVEAARRFWSTALVLVLQWWKKLALLMAAIIAVLGAIVFLVSYQAKLAEEELLQGKREAARESARERLKAQEEVLTIGTDIKGFKFLREVSEAGFGELQGVLIEIEGLSYGLYRKVLSRRHIVYGLPRVGHFTAYALWTADCDVGTTIEIKGQFDEVNVTGGRRIGGATTPEIATLSCIQAGGSTWIMRYAIFPSETIPSAWAENYGGFKVYADFDDRMEWDFDQGVQAATLNSIKVESKGYPESIF